LRQTYSGIAGEREPLLEKQEKNKQGRPSSAGSLGFGADAAK
jgi:hypothetical protein